MRLNFHSATNSPHPAVIVYSGSEDTGDYQEIVAFPLSLTPELWMAEQIAIAYAVVQELLEEQKSGG